MSIVFSIDANPCNDFRLTCSHSSCLLNLSSFSVTFPQASCVIAAASSASGFICLPIQVPEHRHIAEQPVPILSAIAVCLPGFCRLLVLSGSQLFSLTDPHRERYALYLGNNIPITFFREHRYFFILIIRIGFPALKFSHCLSSLSLYVSASARTSFC